MPRPRPSTILPAIGFILGSLAACSYLPRAVEGLPSAAPWFALPLSQWLAAGRAEPEAVAACEECGPGIAVGIVRLSGPEALDAEAVLRAPQGLARSLEAPPDQAKTARSTAKAVRTRASVRPVQVSGHTGFFLTLGRADAAKPPVKPPVYGEALGRREGDGLRVILVIGGDPLAVEETARQVAGAHRGS